MTLTERRNILDYKAERARRRWNDDRMWWWFAGCWIWLAVYLGALKFFGVI